MVPIDSNSPAIFELENFSVPLVRITLLDKVFDEIEECLTEREWCKDVRLELERRYVTFLYKVIE